MLRRSKPAKFVPKEKSFQSRRPSQHELPVYLSIPEAADAMNRSTESARRWLARAKLIQKRGGKPCVVVAKFLAEFPECRQRVYLAD